MADKLFLFQVRHPERGEVTVTAKDRYGAVVQAAKLWGERWTVIAGACRVELLRPAMKPRCKRCGSEFGEPGGTGELCYDCAKALELAEKQKPRYIKKPDRRAGVRGK